MNVTRINLYRILCPILLAMTFPAYAVEKRDLHEQLLELAQQQQQDRRSQFAAISTNSDLKTLQKSLRAKFLRLLGGLSHDQGDPTTKIFGQIVAEDYVIEKLAFESSPGHFVPSLLYKPKAISGPLPAIISPCGHSPVGKAAGTYQVLHINLVKRGFIVLTYDPIGQGERSQFWNVAEAKSRFNLVCGEHAVLGNPLYLLGTSLARYRILDGLRAIDYLTSLPEVDSDRIGCVGNSGGGTLTAYVSALDPRIKAAAIGCYITALPRRMANRIEADPDADPEQDIAGFVSDGIDHAGLLALRVPRPTLLASAQFDFFPIEGARESFMEAKRLYKMAGVADRVEMAEAAEKHGLSRPLRKSIYSFFERWLAERKVNIEIAEIEVKPRSTAELLVCPDGQVNESLKSRHLFEIAQEDFPLRQQTDHDRADLLQLLNLDPDQSSYNCVELSPGRPANDELILFVNGNESQPWQKETQLMQKLKDLGRTVAVVDPRGVGTLRVKKNIKGHDYADPLTGVEENLAYNAFLVGKSLVGMRVADVQAAVGTMANEQRSRIVLCGRGDAALVVCLVAAIEPRVTHVAIQQMPLTFRHYFSPNGQPVNAASIVPSILRDYGDVCDILGAVSPRQIFCSGCIGDAPQDVPGIVEKRELISRNPSLLIDWLRK